MDDAGFTAISLSVLLLLALAVRKAPSEEARRGRLLLVVVMAAFVGVSYYLRTAVSVSASQLWSTAFWLLLAGWGLRLRDYGLMVIGVVFALLFFVVGFALPWLAG